MLCVCVFFPADSPSEHPEFIASAPGGVGYVASSSRRSIKAEQSYQIDGAISEIAETQENAWPGTCFVLFLFLNVCVFELIIQQLSTRSTKSFSCSVSGNNLQ